MSSGTAGCETLQPPDGITADPLDHAGSRSHSLRQQDSARAEGGNELLLTVGRGLFGLDCPSVRRHCAPGAVRLCGPGGSALSIYGPQPRGAGRAQPWLGEDVELA